MLLDNVVTDEFQRTSMPADAGNRTKVDQKLSNDEITYHIDYKNVASVYG